MPSTYTLISSTVLTTNTTSVTLSSIPSTYTDLVLRISGRDSNATANNGEYLIEFNGDTATNYSLTNINGSGSAVASTRYSTRQYFDMVYQKGPTAGNTANTFSSVEIYIPNYASTSSRPLSSFGVGENNATASYIVADAALYRGTSAITSIKINPTNNFVSGSSFYLYGIKNS